MLGFDKWRPLVIGVFLLGCGRIGFQVAVTDTGVGGGPSGVGGSGGAISLPEAGVGPGGGVGGNPSGGDGGNGGNPAGGVGGKDNVALNVCGNGLLEAGEACDDSGGSATCTSQCQVLTCPADCDCRSYAGHSYMFCGDNRSWSSASGRCGDQGMQLARIDGPGEEAWIREQLDELTRNNPWLGGQDSGNDEVWRFPDGEAFWSGGPTGGPEGGHFTNWDPGFPNVQDNCMFYDGPSTGRWSTSDCDAARNYVCEDYPPSPQSCGNGQLDPGEACDGGGENAECDVDCTVRSCGDGLVNRTAGEQCDALADATCNGCSRIKQALLVTDQVQLDARDSHLQSLLEQEGFTVTRVPDDDINAASTQGMSLIVIGPGANSGLGTGSLSSAAVPIAIFDGGHLTSYGLTQDSSAFLATTLRITQAAHPITSGFSGEVVVSQSRVPTLTGDTVASAMVLATDDQGRSALWVFEADTPLTTGGAPARRAALWAERPDLLTAAGDTLIGNTFNWLVQPPVPIYDNCVQLLSKHPTLPDGFYVVDRTSYTPTNCARN